MDWSKLTLCIVTGSTGPLGSAISRAVATKLSPKSVLVVTSRSQDRLKSLESELKLEQNNCSLVKTVWDLSQPSVDKFREDMKSFRVVGRKFENVVLIHNAAQLGDVAMKVKQMTDIKQLQEQININLFSFLCLNSAFLEVFVDAANKTIVNMTASSAVTPKPSFGMTSMVKSSRQLLLNILRLEESDVNVVQFNPIAVDTEALRELRDHSHDLALRKVIAELYEQNKVLGADRVAAALVKAISSRQYEQGTVIDAVQAEQLDK